MSKDQIGDTIAYLKDTFPNIEIYPVIAMGSKDFDLFMTKKQENRLIVVFLTLKTEWYFDTPMTKTGCNMMFKYGDRGMLADEFDSKIKTCIDNLIFRYMDDDICSICLKGRVVLSRSEFCSCYFCNKCVDKLIQYGQYTIGLRVSNKKSGERGGVEKGPMCISITCPQCRKQTDSNIGLE